MVVYQVTIYTLPILWPTIVKEQMMKKWITVPSSELTNIDYNNLALTDPSTTPKNLAGDTALIKWRGDMPADVASISGKGTELDHAGAIALLNTSEWKEELVE